MRRMDPMRSLEFWATILGLVIFVVFMGSIVFGLFPITSALFVGVIIFLIALAWGYGRKNKIIIISALVIVLIVYLSWGSLTNLFAEAKIGSISNIPNQANFDPKCEQKIVDLIGSDQTFYIWLNNEQGIKLEPIKLVEHTYGPNNMDSVTEYWRIFGQPKVSSTIRWGENVGENRAWLYGGIVWDYTYSSSKVTDSSGMILGDNEIKFRMQIKDMAYDIKNGLATTRSSIGYGNQPSAVDKIIAIPLKDVLQITECNIVD